MGWDIVAIGINHNLPINDPIKVAEKLSPLVSGPISIGYLHEWEYDKSTNTIKRPDDLYNWIEIGIVGKDKSGTPYRMEDM
ncbi:MAG: hypothetical protein K2H59_01425 [Muribaculaceae bacterium]|nr:hypothetical protein [Muribaculaceae bacterium]